MITGHFLKIIIIVKCTPPFTPCRQLHYTLLSFFINSSIHNPLLSRHSMGNCEIAVLRDFPQFTLTHRRIAETASRIQCSYIDEICISRQTLNFFVCECVDKALSTLAGR